LAQDTPGYPEKSDVLFHLCRASGPRAWMCCVQAQGIWQWRIQADEMYRHSGHIYGSWVFLSIDFGVPCLFDMGLLFYVNL
jgi:hypothetical protein